MLRPQLKNYSRLVDDGSIRLSRDTGVYFTLDDPDGQVLALLDLLDGTRTPAEVAQTMARRWPDLTHDDVDAGIAALNQAGMLEDAAATTDLSAWQQERYFSNLAFFGTFADLAHSRYAFQEQLRRSHVVLLGVGGLGSTLLLNLAGLGVGHVTALDSDRVELKNLARQFLYSEAEVGQPKLARAVARAQAFNSEMQITAVERRVTGVADIIDLLPGADLVLSAIDQPAQVQEWVNQACVTSGLPFITGGMDVARGVYYSVDPGHSGCLACWNLLRQRERGDRPSPSPRDRINRGIGPVASLVAAFIGLEAVRYLTRFAPPVSAGKLWLADFASGEVSQAYEWSRVADCPVCGSAAIASGTAGAAVAMAGAG